MQPPSKPKAFVDMVVTRPWLLAAALFPLLASCGVTSRMEPYKQTDAVIGAGEHVVILARKQHATHEAEEDFVQCISTALARGDNDFALLLGYRRHCRHRQTNRHG